MDLIKKLIELVYYYRVNQATGKPLLAGPGRYRAGDVSDSNGACEKYFGLVVDPALQLKIVGVITGIGALVSPHTGKLTTRRKKRCRRRRECRNITFQTSS